MLALLSIFVVAAVVAFYSENINTLTKYNNVLVCSHTKNNILVILIITVF